MIATEPNTPTISIQQDSFDPAQAEHAVLCLEVGKDRFRFAMLDEQQRCCWLEEYAFSSLLSERPLLDFLPTLFQQHPVLSIESWKQINIAINSPSFTLIPRPLYRKEYASSYLSFMRGSALPAHEFAQAYLHESDDCYLVFNVDHRLSDFFAGQYPLQQPTFVHQTSALLQAAGQIDEYILSTQNLLLYFENEFVTILLRSTHELKYCNRFGYKNSKDLTYYLLYVIDELNLEPFSVNTLLYGEITPFSETYSDLSAFLPHLMFGHTPPKLSFTTDFDELPEHRYLSLYGLTLLPAQ